MTRQKLVSIVLGSLLLISGVVREDSAEAQDSLKEPNVRKVIDKELDEFERANAAWEAGKFEEVTATTVAGFVLSNGNTIRFFAIPEDAEAGMVESIPDGSYPVFQNQQRSLLATYLALAPTGAAIPKILMVISEPEEAKKLVGDRSIVSKVASDVYIEVERLGITPTEASRHRSKGTGYCTKTPAGATYFTVHSCKSENLQTSYCDPGSFITNWQWTQTVRQAGNHKRKNSYGRTAACVATGFAKHYYWSGTAGTWKHAKTFNINANSQRWKRHEGLSKRYRRIRHKTNHKNLGGFIRSWSEFHN